MVFVSCHLAHIFVFSDVPALALKSRGISGHVTVRSNLKLNDAYLEVEVR